MAVGSRSQSARTYLEKHLDEFLTCETTELIKHGLRALRDTLPNELELNNKVCIKIRYLRINVTPRRSCVKAPVEGNLVVRTLQ